VVVIFFLFSINLFFVSSLFCFIFYLAERSLGHAGPRLSDSWIFQISRDKAEKKIYFTRRATEEEL